MENIAGCGVWARGHKNTDNIPLVIGDKTRHQGPRSINIHQHHFFEKGSVLSEKLLYRFLGQFITRHFRQVAIFRLVQKHGKPRSHNKSDEEKEEHNGCKGQHIKGKFIIGIRIGIL